MADFTAVLDGLGVVAGYSTDGGTVWIPFDNLLNVTLPEATADTRETTHLNSPQNVKTFKGSQVNPGSFSAKMHYSEAQYVALRALVGTTVKTKVAVHNDDGSPGTHLTQINDVVVVGPKASEAGTDNLDLEFSGQCSGPATVAAAVAGAAAL